MRLLRSFRFVSTTIRRKAWRLCRGHDAHVFKCRQKLFQKLAEKQKVPEQATHLLNDMLDTVMLLLSCKIHQATGYVFEMLCTSSALNNRACSSTAVYDPKIFGRSVVYSGPHKPFYETKTPGRAREALKRKEQSTFPFNSGELGLLRPPNETYAHQKSQVTFGLTDPIRIEPVPSNPSTPNSLRHEYPVDKQPPCSRHSCVGSVLIQLRNPFARCSFYINRRSFSTSPQIAGSVHPNAQIVHFDENSAEDDIVAYLSGSQTGIDDLHCYSMPSEEQSITAVQSELESRLRRSLQMLEPEPWILSKREETCQRVEAVIREAFGNTYTVELFGSTRYGVSTAFSDLDMVIIDPYYPRGFHPAKYIPRNVQGFIVQGEVLDNYGFDVSLVVTNAVVPIVKFRDPSTELDCDINSNERLGLLNSELLNHYCNISPILRPMLQLIKLWARPRGLNWPSKRLPVTFSSYALALLTIGFLQSRGNLPNLQQDTRRHHPSNARKWWFRRQCVDTNFSPQPDFREPDAVKMTLSQAMLEWFTFWGYKYDFYDSVVDIRSGGILVPSKIIERAQPLRCMLVDPFILSKNVTQSITPSSLRMFKRECQDAVTRIEKRGRNLYDIIALPEAI